MFRKQKLYEIVWEFLGTHTVIIPAKDEAQAIKKFYKKYDHMTPSIISFKEYKFETQNKILNGEN